MAILLLLLATAFAQDTILQVARVTPQLRTFYDIVTSPGYENLAKMYDSPIGFYTAFAPNNLAFTAVKLNLSNVDYVTQVFNYHTLPEIVYSTDLQPLQFLNSLLSDSRYVNLGPKVGQVTGVSNYGGGVLVNWGFPDNDADTAKVVQADIFCSNGVIHIVDKVFQPFPTTISATAQEAGLTTLVQALNKANLTATVDNATAITVFAPTNDAFNAVNWSQLTIAQLTTILTYHVVPGVVHSSDLSNNEPVVAPTLDGTETLTITKNDPNVLVAGARSSANVLAPDVLVKNGVVHVVDTVLLPGNVPSRRV